MSLLNFYNDRETSKEVHEYLIKFLEDETVRMVFAREYTGGLADAKELIDKAFDHLDEIYGIKPKKNTINKAR